jgi:ATP-dependent DNA helicase RecQ
MGFGGSASTTGALASASSTTGGVTLVVVVTGVALHAASAMTSNRILLDDTQGGPTLGPNWPGPPPRRRIFEENATARALLCLTYAMMALALVESLLNTAESRLPAFGIAELRPWQRDALRALLEGSRRVLVVAPTGGGKSLTYQLPSLVLPRTTLVLSPLVALMEDQVHALQEKGIAATFIASTLGMPERRAREDALARGAYKIVYVAPERLANGAFVDLLRHVRPSLIAVDEAHCISQWGHDFRPDYLRVGTLLEQLHPERVLACTATATPDVRREILLHLGFDRGEHDVVLRGFARPNLHLSASSVDGPREVRRRTRATLISALGAGPPKGAGIVYCATRKSAEQLAATLAEETRQWRVGCYHAGMSAEDRTRISSAFATKTLDVVVATNAFGMGIDREDVRAVIHAQPPSSIEAYYQEVGRAGRDGGEAYGLLMCSGSDIAVRRRLVEQGSAEQVARAWKLFRELLKLLDARTCRHDFVLRYFGDEGELLGGCGHCDVCETESGQDSESEDVVDARRQATTVIVQKALSGVARANRRGGLAAVASMLVGADEERVRRFGFTRLSTFGLFKGESVEWVTAVLRSLLAAGWIDLTPTDHPVPYVTKVGWDVMKGTLPTRMVVPPRIQSRRMSKPAASIPESVKRDALFVRLRDHRADVAKRRQLPAYVVAHDRTLVELVAKRPRTLADLVGIHGFGPSRIDQYGEGFLAVINQI